MKKIACVGTEQFTLGFQLAGIREAINLEASSEKRKILDALFKVRANKDIGIIILDESLLEKLDGHEKSEILDSVEPVFLPLSENSGSGDIRKLIIKSIGVDLWKGE